LNKIRNLWYFGADGARPVTTPCDATTSKKTWCLAMHSTKYSKKANQRFNSLSTSIASHATKKVSLSTSYAKDKTGQYIRLTYSSKLLARELAQSSLLKIEFQWSTGRILPDEYPEFVVVEGVH